MSKENYILVRGGTPVDLAREVNRKIEEGFLPLGGVSTVIEQGDTDYHQAMISKELAMPGLSV